MTKEQRKIYYNRWLKKNFDYNLFRKRVRKLKVDISYEEYLSLDKKQNGVCAICLKPEENKSLAIDHCHKTNKVRGLLCQKCNRGIGFFEDDKNLLENAISYLN